MKLPLLKVAVVGHTNTGKTSLMRTLMRDTQFGEVSDRPATTRHVEGAKLLVRGEPAIELYDTPGLEDSIALLDHLDSLRGEDRRTPGVDIIKCFLESPAAHERFAQEAKALRQVMASDVALYVIDARDRVLGKHHDELEILSRCARPIVSVLNFIASPEANVQLWRDHLSRANLHSVAEFDTVVLDEEGERRLLEKMRTMLDRHTSTLNALIDDLQAQRERLLNGSLATLADMLIDVASLVVTAPAAGKEAEIAMNALKQRVRDREQQCVEQLLTLHRFRPEDVQNADTPLAEGRWGVDLFSPAAMKQFGIRTGSAAAAGAMIGLTVDAMVGGASLGAASAIGAAIGALLGTGQTHGKRLLDRMRGFAELRCDDNTLKLLIARQLSLIHALLRRGHASLTPIAMQSANERMSAGLSPRHLPHEIDEARLRPQWSRLADRPNHLAVASPPRQQTVDELTNFLSEQLRGSYQLRAGAARSS